MTDLYFESTVNGEPISIYVTKKNDIMIEADDCGCIDPETIREAVNARGFNTCFSTSEKRNFAKSCHFNNIYISKNSINDDGDCEKIFEYTLADLRKSKRKLAELLER